MAKSIPINTVLTYRLKQINCPARLDALLYSDSVRKLCFFILFCILSFLLVCEIPPRPPSIHNIRMIISLKMYLGEINLYT